MLAARQRICTGSRATSGKPTVPVGTSTAAPACKTLKTSHEEQCDLLEKLREIPGVKKVFIGSGIRYDLALADDAGYLRTICDHHVSGHLKVAPEHIAKKVTGIMNKPDRAVFDRFREQFETLQKGKKSGSISCPTSCQDIPAAQ